MKTKLITTAVVATAIVVGVVGGQSKRVGPVQAYPDARLSPGLVATSDFKELTAVSSCGTYSKCHRKTSDAMKATVCKEYPTNCTGTQEIDHIGPLALGFADDIKNLWAEPEHLIVDGFDYGFHTKDRLENQLVLMMKAGKISPKEAQNCILNDWVACYQKWIGKSFGGFSSVEAIDPDGF